MYHFTILIMLLNGAIEMVAMVRAYITHNVSFGPIQESDLLFLLTEAKKIDPNYTEQHIKIVRTMELPYLRTLRIRLVRENSSIMAAIYKDCASVKHNVAGCLEIAEKYKIPPMFVPTRLGYDEQIKLEAFDLTSPSIANLTRKCADMFESEVEQYLRQKNIKFKTEMQLRHSKSQLTPDFLLDSPTLIKDIFGTDCVYHTGPSEKIKWIDAKNYPMFGLRLTYEKMIKQAKKYNDEFGAGAYIFANGVMAKDSRIIFPSAALIDGSYLCASSLSCIDTIN